MRLASATGFLAVALLATACGSTPRRAPGDVSIGKQLASLGFEGRTYMHDLSEAASVNVHAVHRMDDDLLIEDLHGHLTYVDGSSLNVSWEFYGLPRPFSHAPSFTPSAIVGIADGWLFVISRANGVPSPDPRVVDVIPSASPVANDTTIYVPTYPTPAGNKTVYAISLGSGYQGWGQRTHSDVTADMAKGGQLGGDTIYFATETGEVYAFPAYVATERKPEAAWTAHAQSHVRYDLSVSGEDLGVVTDDGRMICYDRITGGVRWEAYGNNGERAEGAAQFSENHAFYRRAGSFHAYARDTGTPAWSIEGATTFLAERDDKMLIGAPGGVVMSVDTATGKVLGRAHLPGVRFPAQPVKNGTVHVVTNHGLLMAVEYGW